MDEQTLRAMIRESIARHAQPAPTRADVPAEPLPFGIHPSHYRYSLSKPDDRCIIEPSVPCNHCGYCESHGH
jgi:hypothetical protein